MTVSSKPRSPSRLDALSWSGFHTRVVLALGITWILDGLEVTLAGALSGALKESPTLQFSNFDVGLANSAYLAGAVLGALGFGWLTDRIGRRKLFFITLALYLSATAATALSWSVAKLRAVSLPDRRRHRRRIHRDQFDHPGTGAGALSRLDRSRHQRQLLDRRGDRRDQRHRAARSRGRRRRSRLAAGLFHRRGPRPDRAGDADVDSGKPALADDPRPSRRGARDRRRHRTLGDRTYTGSPGSEAFAEDQAEDAQPHAARRGRAYAVLDLSPALAGGTDADGRAGVLLQRDLLHLRAGADRFLRHRRRPCRLVHPALCGRQLPRPAACSAACSTRWAGAP